MHKEDRTSLQNPSEVYPEQLKSVLNTESESWSYKSLIQQHPASDSVGGGCYQLRAVNPTALHWMAALGLLISMLTQAPELL